MKKIKESLDRITLPESVKASVKAKINSAVEENACTSFNKKSFFGKKGFAALVSCALVAAIIVAVIPAMRTDAPNTSTPDPNGSTHDNSDWVYHLFATEDNKNVCGDIISAVTENNYATDERVDLEDIFAAEEPPAETAPNQGIMAGTLTAGIQNDNKAFNSFTEALQTLCSDSNRGINPVNRITVTVPRVFNAMVALADADGKIMALARTNINGVAYLYYNLRGEKDVPYVVGISKGSFFTEVKVSGRNEITVEPDSEFEEQLKLDLLLMIDTTGSMSDELEYIKVELRDMIERISAECKNNVDIRLSVNFYRDHGDDYVVRYFEFTNDIEACISYITEQRADGGGDYPEAVDEALLNATEHQWRDDAVKVMFMVLDAPPHSESERQGVNDNIFAAVRTASSLGIRINPIVASGANNDLEATMRTAAAISGGSYLYLTDDSGVGESHKKPENVASGVFPLNDLMVDTVLECIIPNRSEPISESDNYPDNNNDSQGSGNEQPSSFFDDDTSSTVQQTPVDGDDDAYTDTSTDTMIAQSGSSYVKFDSTIVLIDDDLRDMLYEVFLCYKDDVVAGSFKETDFPITESSEEYAVFLPDLVVESYSVESYSIFRINGSLCVMSFYVRHSGQAGDADYIKQQFCEIPDKLTDDLIFLIRQE